jgi:hypothetical protein
MLISPPSFPLRPVNGGPLPQARPKRGRWIWEPKVNGWRAWINTHAGQAYNRKNEPLSIEREFAPILARLKAANLPIIWLDTEAFERRHPLGRGSLVLLDFAPGVYPGGYTLPLDLTLEQRQIFMEEATNGLAVPWRFLHEPPPENSLLYFAYTFNDYGIAAPTDADWLPNELRYRGEDFDGIHTGWRLLQDANRRLGVELFEGLVAKRTDSRYPLQLRTPDQEFPFWMKHRWRF